MHIPDGFIDGGTSAAAGIVAFAGVSVCAKKASETLDERQVPLAGLAAAYVFAAQMLNFPVAAGTSGHLLGAVLAAVLVGPYAGAVCMTVVLVVQALLFADGGLSALGLNVINIALVGALGGYAIFVCIRRVLRPSSRSVVAAAGLAAAVAPVLAAVAFTIEYAFGGNDAATLSTVAAAMVGVHTLVGIGEGVITGLTVAAVMASRPDLVYGARDLVAPRAPDPAAVAAPVEAA